MTLKLTFEERKTLKLSNNPQDKTERPSLSPATYHYQCGKFIITRLTNSSSSGWEASRAPTKRSFPPHSGRSLFWLHRCALGSQGALTFTLIVSVLSFSNNTFFFVSMEALTRQQIIRKILNLFPLKTWYSWICYYLPILPKLSPFAMHCISEAVAR